MKEQLKYLIYDLDRWAYAKKLPVYFIWLVIFIYPARWAIVIYRIGRMINLIPFKLIRIVFKIPYYIVKRLLCESFLSIDISDGADIGPGLYIAHSGAVVIGTGVKAGRNFSIRQGVTCGGSGNNGLSHPIFGNNVILSAGVKVIGKVHIGSNVIIGANAVVIKDIPDNSRAVGIPAKPINFDGVYGVTIRKKWNY
ncbi:serine O-acetyltransferase [bacterium]|jgi:serine O-acetyltransferase|nr:serine O-acetyltransferase [bacterium]